MVDVGADPEVIINNTTYPIATSQRNDGDITVSLDKLETKNVTITDDEMEYIAYDKVAGVTESHQKAMDKTKYAKAVHALSPASDATDTPVVKTTGSDDGNGRRRLSKKEILVLKSRFDKLKIPMSDRLLVLSADHYNDLLMEDEHFSRQLYDPRTGSLLPYMGFEIHLFVDSPYYNATSGGKLSFGAVPTADDYAASTAFYAPDMFRATGNSKVYMSKSEDDPKYRENLIGMRHFYVVLPRKERAIGAIISDKV